MRKTIFLFYLALISLVYLPTYAQISSTTLNPEINIKIPGSTGTNYYNLDLDNNGSVDYKFSVRYFTTSEFSHRDVPSYSATITGIDQNKVCAGPFQLNDSISVSANYFTKDNIYSYIPESGGRSGAWAYSLSSSDDIAYVGLKLDKNGSTYYGWVRLKSNGKTITIYSYAVNTSPNIHISAGQEN